MAKARARVTGHILGAAINTAALLSVGGMVGNFIAGAALAASFTPVFIAPALVAGAIYGLFTMPVYVIVIDEKGDK